jgi:hypothetical protein
VSDIHSHAEIKVGSERSFGLVFTAVFAVVGLWPVVHGEPIRFWVILIAAGFLAISIGFPRALYPLNRAWFHFGMLLGRLVSPIVMALLFFIAVTPTALVMRLFGKDPLRLKLDRSLESYWIDRDRAAESSNSMKNQF